MAVPSASKNKEKIHEVQEIFIKNLLMRCKSEHPDGTSSSGPEELWQMPEMVGFYSEAQLPITSVQTADEVASRLSIKKVVCSPDLPIPEFPNKETTTIITSSNSSNGNIQCPICLKMYSSKAGLQAHQRTHTKETDDPYRCNICSKTFAVPARLTRHYRTHTGEKPFRCEFCNKSFSVKENLSVHRRIHTKERPYKCEVCSRAFEHSGKLHRHMRIHTGERPHKCNVCAKTFIQSGQLVIHMRTHTGEKPYVCTVCQKGFTCSKQLKVHSRTHTGEKPYSCEICGKSFGYNHVLKLHQVAHYGEKVYKCTICNDTFNSKKSMEAHIKSHSDNTPPTVPTPPASSVSSESSCSSTSDKENNKLDSSPIHIMHQEQQPIRYYIQTTAASTPERGGVSPTYLQTYASPSSGVELLAAAATATAERDERYHNHHLLHRSSPDIVFNIIKSTHQHHHSQDMFVSALRNPAYFTTSPTVQYTPLHAGDELRRKVEEALSVEEFPTSEEEPMLTPPSSNPVSPAPSISPPVSPDPELSLPPRKRSKMILKSMESSIGTSPVRYSSVIQYARAS